MTNQTVAEALVAFSDSQPEWQRDALRRLATKGSLSDSDIEDLLLILKSEIGLPLPEGSKPPNVQPLNLHHLEGSGSTQRKVSLRKISNVRNVNRLAPCQTIEFGDGITLLYGDNGSGKSGYVRLLKKACAARGNEKEPILADVFKSDYAHAEAASLEIGITVEEPPGNETNHSFFLWSIDQPAREEMRQLRVFDAKIAVTSVSDENEIQYTPFNLDLLDDLAEICDKIEKKILSEIEQAQMYLSRLADKIPEVGKARDFAKRIKYDTPETEIYSALLFEVKDRVRLSQLMESLQRSEQEVAYIEHFVDELNILCSDAKILRDAISLDAVRRYTELVGTVASTSLAAKELRQKTFSTAIINGIGEDAWRRLWDAARAFSVSIAYPDKPFPVTGSEDDDARCVLCQQPISSEAADRLRTFEEFVEAKITCDNEQARKEVDEAIERLEEIDGRVTDEKKSLIQQADTWDRGINDVALNFFKKANQARLDVIECLRRQEPPSVSNIGEAEIVERVEKLLNAVNQRLRLMKEAKDPEKRGKLEAERDILREREALHAKKETILEVKKYREIEHKLQKALAKTKTKQISEQKRRLDERFVSDPFNNAVNEERDKLGVVHNIKVGFRRDRAKTLHRPLLDGTAYKSIEDILSEGEHRALALACFIAEARMSQIDSPLIIDDPVSSLDHMHIERVAARLAELGTKRQVIIFTHSYVFASELIDRCDEYRTPIQSYWIKRDTEGRCGLIDRDKAPWQLMRTRERIKELEKRLEGMKKEKESSVGPCVSIKDFYMHMRETWERAVEEILLGDVIQRYRPSVETLRLRYACVDDEDYREVCKGMRRCSRYSGHDQATARQTALPDIRDMENDFRELRDYVDKIMGRKNDIEKRRKER